MASRWGLRKQGPDQLAHIAWAMLGTLPVAVLAGSAVPLWGYGLAAVLWALPRELWDQWPIRYWIDTVIDLVFFAIGGVLMGRLVMFWG